MQQMKTKPDAAMQPMQMNADMQQCIDNCQNCHTVCLQHASQHCLEVGGDHVAPAHFRLMLACAQICQTSADFMLMNAEMHAQLCGVCAQVCNARDGIFDPSLLMTLQDNADGSKTGTFNFVLQVG